MALVLSQSASGRSSDEEGSHQEVPSGRFDRRRAPGRELRRRLGGGERGPSTVAGIRAYAEPFLAKARAHRPTAIFANFAGDGTKYVRYPTERAFARELRAFLDGPAPGGGSFVARVYRVAGSRGAYVTFDPGVANSLTEHERIVFDGRGRAMWLQEEVDSYNGFYRTVRDAYFAGGVPIADRTIRYDYAPRDTAFRKPLKRSKAELDEMTIPVYETRAKLPFSA